MDNNLNFSLNNEIKVNNEEFLVIGGITFNNKDDDYNWQEFKLRSLKNKKIKWLSVDLTYDEYAIYTESISKLNLKGYKKADYGQARVISFFGDVDVDRNEIVEFEEYEDFSEENIISIEKWNEETEYSKGYYIDKEDIQFISAISRDLSQSSFPYQTSNKTKSIFSFIAISIVTLIIMGIFIGLLGSNKTKISDFIKKDSNFIYLTSITSDLNHKEKANVYSTTLTVEDAAKKIIDGINGKLEDVQENTDDNTVAILTKYEYCLVYTDTNNETLVQINSRLYTYSSTHSPYRSNFTTSNYYRRYYYSRGFFNDKNKYSKYTTGFNDTDYTYVDSNYNDKYKTYSSSVRQSSVGSRTSSGGGTSSGK